MLNPTLFQQESHLRRSPSLAPPNFAGIVPSGLPVTLTNPGAPIYSLSTYALENIITGPSLPNVLSGPVLFVSLPAPWISTIPGVSLPTSGHATLPTNPVPTISLISPNTSSPGHAANRQWPWDWQWYQDPRNPVARDFGSVFRAIFLRSCKEF